MGIGVSVFLLAVGAILAFAVDVQTQGLDLNTVGVILMIVGTIGLLMSLVFWERMGFGGSSYRRTVVRDHFDDEPVVATRRRGVVRERVVEDDIV